MRWIPFQGWCFPSSNVIPASPGLRGGNRTHITTDVNLVGFGWIPYTVYVESGKMVLERIAVTSFNRLIIVLTVLQP